MGEKEKHGDSRWNSARTIEVLMSDEQGAASAPGRWVGTLPGLFGLEIAA